jgi:hypothetical protein
LRPAALPLEIIHQAPVEIALDLVIMADHVPQFVQVLDQIAPAKIIL